MEIDWFWLAVIITVISLAMVISLANYFSYKSAVHGCSNGKKDDKKEDKPNE